MNATPSEGFTGKQTRKQSDKCRFCRVPVNLDDEGVTYRDGSCAHEHCHDGNEYRQANESDFRD